jgi:hypothetical protein
MTLPAAWKQVSITGTYTNRDSTAATGWVTFESQQVVTFGGVLIVPRTITGTLNANG